MSDATRGGMPPVEAMDEWFLGFVMQHGGEPAVRAYLQSRMLDAKGLPWVLRAEALRPEERRARAELWLRSVRTCRDRLGLNAFDVECRLGPLHDAWSDEELQPEDLAFEFDEDWSEDTDKFLDELLAVDAELWEEDQVQGQAAEVEPAEDCLVEADAVQDDPPARGRQRGEGVLPGATGPEEKGESAEAQVSALQLDPEGFESTEGASK